MSHAMSPDESRKFGKAVLEAVGVDGRQVIDGSISVSIDSSSDTAHVTWQGVARLSREDLAKIVGESQDG